MSQTVVQVKKQALQLLGVVRPKQSPSATDDTEIGTAYNEVYSLLKKKALATWTSTGTLPDEVVPFVVALVAFYRVDHYSVSGERYQRIVGRASGAIKGIEEVTTPIHESTDEPEDF